MKPTFRLPSTGDVYCSLCAQVGMELLTRGTCIDIVEGFMCDSPDLECAKCSTHLFDIVADGDLYGEDLARYTHG